jgi:glycine cleavage system H protein
MPLSVSGIVVEKNEALEKAPSLINSSPYGDGWIFKVRLSDGRELDTLMTEESYETYLKEQEEH